MNRNEIRKLLEEYLNLLRQNGANSRKTDMVKEAMEIISSAKDEETVIFQLRRVDELIGTMSKPSVKEVQTVLAEQKRPSEEQFLKRIRQILSSSHQEALTIGENLMNSADNIIVTTEREVTELNHVNAHFNELLDRKQLEQYIGTAKAHYLGHLERQRKELVSDVTAVYEHSTDKIKRMLTREDAGNLRMTEKEMYERFNNRHDTFLVRAGNAGKGLDLTGSAFENLAERLEKKSSRIKKGTSFTMLLCLLLVTVLWGCFFSYKNQQINQAVSSIADVKGMVTEAADSLDGAGSVLKMAVESEAVGNIIDTKLSGPAEEVIASLVKVMLISYGVIMICSYIILVPILLWIKKRSRLKKLEKAVQAETKDFMEKAGLKQLFFEGTRNTIQELEDLYSAAYRDLTSSQGSAAPQQPEYGQTPDKLEVFAGKWRKIKEKYGI